MNKLKFICICILAVPLRLIADIMELFSYMFYNLNSLFHNTSNQLEDFITFLINKNRRG